MAVVTGLLKCGRDERYSRPTGLKVGFGSITLKHIELFGREGQILN